MAPFMFTLSPSSFQLLKKINFSEMGDSVSFDEKTHTVKTSNLRLLQIILIEEINTKGLTDDKQEATPHGHKLEVLYDEILDLTSR